MDKRIIKTRKAIVKAYMEAFASHPDTPVTVVEICDRAEINKTTFYRNYTDLMDLHYQIVEILTNKTVIDPQRMYMFDNPREYFERLNEYLETLSPEQRLFLNYHVMDVMTQGEAVYNKVFRERYGDENLVAFEFLCGGIQRAMLRFLNKQKEIDELVRYVEAVKSAIPVK